MYVLLILLHVLVCLFLIAVILLQTGRGGVSEAFGGGPSQSLFGTQGATVLTRATTVCASIFIATCLLLTILSGLRNRSVVEQMRKITPPPAGDFAPAPVEPSGGPQQLPAEQPAVPEAPAASEQPATSEVPPPTP